MPTRVSYKLNLRGPSVNVQTACSTSLVAVHQACRSLLERDCDVALAGGASINVPLKTGYLHLEESILSPDGHCRTFDARAKGTVMTSGVGVVVLKRLADAVADGDPIHAVIRGTAINNDGEQKVGFTAPSVEGQAAVIALAQAAARVDPRDITYIEAHGTATTLGDPIEVAALNRVFANGEPGSCAIGSVKTNIGHLDAAAGVAGADQDDARAGARRAAAQPALRDAEPADRFRVHAVLREHANPAMARPADGRASPA